MNAALLVLPFADLQQNGAERRCDVSEAGGYLPADPEQGEQQNDSHEPHGARMAGQAGSPPALDTVAPERYKGYIEAALSYAGDTHRYEDVAAMIAAGRALLWPGPASVIVTELIEYPRKRVLNVFLAAGRLDELEAMLPPILDWAREQGCDGAMLTGRKGWERTFLTKTGGWRATHVMCVKDLT